MNGSTAPSPPPCYYFFLLSFLRPSWSPFRQTSAPDISTSHPAATQRDSLIQLDGPSRRPLVPSQPGTVAFLTDRVTFTCAVCRLLCGAERYNQSRIVSATASWPTVVGTLPTSLGLFRLGLVWNKHQRRAVTRRYGTYLTSASSILQRIAFTTPPRESSDAHTLILKTLGIPSFSHRRPPTDPTSDRNQTAIVPPPPVAGSTTELSATPDFFYHDSCSLARAPTSR